MSPAETIKIKVYKQIFTTATAELTNNVNYIKVLDSTDEMVGMLDINSVRNRKLWYEYELTEYENILEDLPKS